MQFTRIISPGLIVVFLGLLLLAIALLTVVRVRRGALRRVALIRSAAWVLFVAGAVVTATITLIPAGAAAPSRFVEWNAFSELRSQLGDATTSLTGAAELVINFLLLAWIGLLLPVISRTVKLRTLIAVVIGASLAIEVLQYFVETGRIASAGDVLLNVTGGILASLVGVRFLRPRLATDGRGAETLVAAHQ